MARTTRGSDTSTESPHATTRRTNAHLPNLSCRGAYRCPVHCRGSRRRHRRGALTSGDPCPGNPPQAHRRRSARPGPREARAQREAARLVAPPLTRVEASRSRATLDPIARFARRLLALSQSRVTDPSGSIGLITTVRLWRRSGPISTTGNLVIYEDCLVFATVGPREDGWLGRLVGGSSALDAQFFRIGQEQATVEPQRLALRSITIQGKWGRAGMRAVAAGSGRQAGEPGP